MRWSGGSRVLAMVQPDTKQVDEVATNNAAGAASLVDIVMEPLPFRLLRLPRRSGGNPVRAIRPSS
jgi:hypothetical protein